MRVSLRHTVLLSGLSLLAGACGELVQQVAPPVLRDVRLTAIAGSVELEGLGACAGIELQLVGPEGPTVVTTAAEGRWSLSAVPAGAWVARLHAEGYAATEQVFVADADAEVAVPPLVATLPRVAVRGRVRLEDGGNAAGSAVAAESEMAPTVPAGVDCGGGSGSGAWGVTVLAGPDGVWEMPVPAALRDLSARIRREGYTEADVVVAGDDIAAAAATGSTVAAPEALLYPLTGFVNVVGSTIRADRDVPLQISAFNGVSEMALGEVGADGVCTLADWRAYSATPVFTVAEGDGLHTICVLVRNAEGQQYGPMYTQIELDTVAPSGAIVINLGAATTAQPIVALGIGAGDTGSGVAGLRLAHDEAGLAATGTVAFEATKIWTLAAPFGPGTEAYRSVWLQVLDRAGNASLPVSASILLDRAAPRNLSVLLPGAGGGSCITPGWSGSPLLDVAVAAEDPGLGEGRGELRAAPPSILAETAWQPWAARVVATAQPANGLQEIRVEVRDAAGNVAGPVGACVLIDTQAPVIEAFTAAGDGGDDGWSRDGMVWVSAAPADNLAAAHELSVCFEGDLAVASPACDDAGALWQPWSPPYLIQLVGSSPGTVVTRELAMVVRDPAGNSSVRRRSITVDRQAPGMVPFQVASAGAGRVDLSWGAVAGAVRYRVDYDGQDRAADAMVGGNLVEGASPRTVTGTAVRLHGLRSFEPVFFRVRAIDAAGNVGPDPGQSARATSALVKQTVPVGSLGNGGGTDGRPDMAAGLDALGNLWAAYRGPAGRSLLVRCAPPCADAGDWQGSDWVLGYASAGTSQSLVVAGSRLVLAETGLGVPEIRVGRCDADVYPCHNGNWRWGGSAAWAVTLPTAGAVSHARVRVARDARGVVWAAVAGVATGADRELWLYACHDGGGRCGSPGAWSQTRLAVVPGPGMIHGDLTLHDGTLWLLVTHLNDQSPWLLTCRSEAQDCTDSGNWQSEALPTGGGDVGVATTTQGMQARLLVGPRRGGGVQAVAAIPVNTSVSPYSLNPYKYVGVCEAAAFEDCRDGGNWGSWREWGGDTFDLSLQDDRVVLVQAETFQNRFASWVCRAGCAQRENWQVGPAFEEPSLSAASVALMGWGEGNLHLLYGGLLANVHLIRPLLLPPARTDLALSVAGLRAQWSAMPGSGYGVDLVIGTDRGAAQTVLVDDPGQLQLDVQVGADKEVLTALRTRSTLGSSEAGNPVGLQTPRAFSVGVPPSWESGTPRNDNYRTGVVAAGAGGQAVLVDSQNDLRLRVCTGNCDGAGVWTTQSFGTPGGEIVWLDLAGDADGYFGLVRTAAGDASAHDLFSIRCEGAGCGDPGNWHLGRLRMSAGAATRPGWAAGAALGAGQLWAAHVVDDELPLPASWQHRGRLVVERCLRIDACDEEADWQQTQLPWGPSQSIGDAHAVVAAGSRAVWVLRSGGPLLLAECVHDGAPALCDNPAAWTHGEVRNASNYGSGNEPWGGLRKYDDGMALAWDPATSTLIAFASAYQWPLEPYGPGVLVCRWVAPGSCAASADWRRVWPVGAGFDSFVPRARVLVSPRRTDVVFWVWNDLFQLGCNGDCVDPTAWTPLARIAENSNYAVGAGAFDGNRIGWVHAAGGGDLRTAATGLPRP